MYRISYLIFPMILILLALACAEKSVDSNADDNGQNQTNLTVISTHPAVGVEMPVTDSVVLTFSGDLNCSTVNDNTVRIDDGLSGTLTCDSNTVIFKPDLLFDFAIAVEVFVSKDVADENGNNLDDDFSYIFYTQVEPGK